MSRRRPVRVLGLLLCVALAFSGFVANADAKRMSKAKKQAISKQLMRAVKKNPKVIGQRWFLKKASQVNWTLPTTIRLLPVKDQAGTRVANVETTLAAPANANDTSITVADATGFTVGSVAFVGVGTSTNDARTVTGISPGNVLTLSAGLPNNHGAGQRVSTLPNGANYATLDLGPSLGARSIGLGGYVNADINFNDAFDGGNLGDVKVAIKPGGGISTTSVALLANDAVSGSNGQQDPYNAIFVGTVLDNSGQLDLTFNGTDVASVAAGSVNPGSLANALASAIAALPNPVTGGPDLIGSNGVYVYAIPAGSGVTRFTITFTGPKFNGVHIPGRPYDAPAGLRKAGSNTAVFPLGAPQNDVLRLADGRPGTLDSEGNGGCNGFQANGQGPINPATGQGDVDHLGNISKSLTPGKNDNVGFGPSYGGSNEPADTVLRTGPLSIAVAAPKGAGTGPGAWSNGEGIPGDSLDKGIGVGTGIVQPAIGASGGVANLFGNPVRGMNTGRSLDVTVNLNTTINSIARQVDGAFPAPAGLPNETLGNISAYSNCRQAWTGGVDNYLTGIQLVGSLKISPAVTADGRLRIARVALKSSRPSSQSLAACLSPYQLYLRGNPFAYNAALGGTDTAFPIAPNVLPANTNGAENNGFNPLAVLLGSGLTAPSLANPVGAPSPNNPPSASTPAANVKCDADNGPLSRAPFNVKTVSNAGTAPTLSQVLSAGAAAAVRGDIDVKNLNGEVLIGTVAGG